MIIFMSEAQIKLNDCESITDWQKEHSVNLSINTKNQ
jgi:hypothetical protein